jgi:hypothetical protein
MPPYIVFTAALGGTCRDASRTSIPDQQHGRLVLGCAHIGAYR